MASQQKAIRFPPASGLSWASFIIHRAFAALMMSLFMFANMEQAAIAQTQPDEEDCRKAAGFDERGNWSLAFKVADDAATICEQAIKQYPDSANIMAYLGRLYYRAGKNKESYSLIELSAMQGNVVGMGLMGVVYEYGYGVEKDYAQAIVWNRKAAEKGLAVAQGNLGLLILNGKGVKADTAEGVAWIVKATEQGNAESQAILGFLYHEGQRVERDDVIAAQWLRKAAEQGHKNAQWKLGMMYFYDDNGLEKNDAESEKWLNKSAEQGYAPARDELNKRKMRVANFALVMHAAQRKKATPEQQFNLGFLYKMGYGTPQDYVQAIKWFSKAAERNYHAALKEIEKIAGKVETLNRITTSAAGGDVDTVNVVRKYAMPYMVSGTKFKDCPECPKMTLVPSGIQHVDYNDIAGKNHVSGILLAREIGFGKLEVSRNQWQAITGSPAPAFSSTCDTGDCPVLYLQENEAQEFIVKLSEKTGAMYRLADDTSCAYVCQTAENKKYCGIDTPATAVFKGEKPIDACGGLGIRIVRMPANQGE